MRHVPRLVILVVGLSVLVPAGAAQQPKAAPGATSTNAAAVDAIVARMMAFDKNKDGKLARDEITDPRLLRLFDRADANKDGVVTKQEVLALATQMVADEPANGGQRGGFGPPGGPGGPGGRGPGGPGGRSQPGQILPPPVQEQLKLTAAQKKQLEELQKEVDAKLGKILTDEQKKQLKNMQQGSPRGRPGGPGGPGGPPPGGPGDRPGRPPA